MGIPGFNTWFSERQREAFIPLDQVPVDHLYIDMNSLLHNSLRKAPTLHQFYGHLFKSLDAMMRTCQPRKSVMLAVDGPAPLAKLLTQRERRKRSFSAEEERGVGESGGRKGRPKPVVSSVALTPGTPFMHDVSVALSFWVCGRLASAKHKDLCFELSGATVAGEGEVKILGRLMRPWSHVRPGDTHVVVADDADLILMALVSRAPSVYVLNASFNRTRNSRSSSNTGGGGGSNEAQVMSMERLTVAWAAAGLLPARLLQDPDVALGARADLALLAMLAGGNDYLPAVRGLSLDALWADYKRLRGQSNSGGAWGGGRSIVRLRLPAEAGGGGGVGPFAAAGAALDVAFLAELMRRNGNCQVDGGLLGVALGGSRSVSGSGGGGSSGASSSDGEWGGVGAAASDSGGDSDGDSAGVAAPGLAGGEAGRRPVDVLGYLRAVVWTLSMYFDGRCPDYRWYYTGGAPTSGQLAWGLQQLAAELEEGQRQQQQRRVEQQQQQVQEPPRPDQRGRQRKGAAPKAQQPQPPGQQQGAGDAASWRAATLVGLDELVARTGGGGGGSKQGPLPPHVCSLALLPAGAAEHVPGAVRHLVQDGSPLWGELFQECEECNTLSSKLRNASRAITRATKQMNQLGKLQQAAQERAASAQPPSDSDALSLLDAQVLELSAELDAVKAEATAAKLERDAHRATHPNRPFPLAALLAAVAAVPCSAVEARERVLVKLGSSYMYRRTSTHYDQVAPKGLVPLYEPPPSPVPYFSSPPQPAQITRCLLRESPSGDVCLLPDDQPHLFREYLLPPPAPSLTQQRELWPVERQVPAAAARRAAPQRQWQEQQGAGLGHQGGQPEPRLGPRPGPRPGWRQGRLQRQQRQQPPAPPPSESAALLDGQQAATDGAPGAPAAATATTATPHGWRRVPGVGAAGPPAARDGQPARGGRSSHGMGQGPGQAPQQGHQASAAAVGPPPAAALQQPRQEQRYPLRRQGWVPFLAQPRAQHLAEAAATTPMQQQQQRWGVHRCAPPPSRPAALPAAQHGASRCASSGCSCSFTGGKGMRQWRCAAACSLAAPSQAGRPLQPGSWKGLPPCHQGMHRAPQRACAASARLLL